MPNKLNFYTKYSKEKIKIADKPLASGGEGAIYAIASPRAYKHLVVKIYYPEKRSSEREAKMKYLIQHPPIKTISKEAPSIGWIKDLLYRNKKFVGILLLRIQGKKLTKLTFNKLPRRADKAWKRFAFGQKDALKLRLHTCFNLAIVIHQIHTSNRYVLVDLKPDNILMQPNGLLAIVDMDSVEVVEEGKAIFSAPVATPEYSPPEFYTSAPSTTVQESWDHFSMAVIFYQLLFGLHPFSASCHPPYDKFVGLNDKIQHHLYVHHSQKQASFKIIPPPHQQFHKSPPIIQDLFNQCFEIGAKDPEKRPTAAQWCEALANLLKLPFSAFPRLDIPPSDLYFQLSDWVAKLPDLNSPISPILKPNLLHTFSRQPITQASSATSLLGLQKAYRHFLAKNRREFMEGIIAFIAILTLLSFFPKLFFFGILGLFFLKFFFPFKTKSTTALAIAQQLLSPSTYQLIINENKESKSQNNLTSVGTILDTLTQKQGKQLKETATNLQQDIAQSSIPFIQLYIQKQADLAQKVASFKTWATSAEIKLKQTRTKELEGYKNALTAFEQQLKDSEHYKAYNFRSYLQLKAQLQKDLSTKQVTIKELEKQIQGEENFPKYQQMLEKLNQEAQQQILAHQKELEQIAGEKFKAFKQHFNDLNQEKEAQYATYQQQQVDLTKTHEKIKEINYQKAKRLDDKLFQDINAGKRILNKRTLKKYIQLFNERTPEQQLNATNQYIEEQFMRIHQQLLGLDLEASKMQPIYNLLTKKIPLTIIPHSNHKNNNPEISFKMMKNHQQNLEQQVTQLKDQLQKLDNKLAETTTDQYWTKIATVLQKIRKTLKNHSVSQKQFYSHPAIFQLKTLIEPYNKGQQTLKRQLENPQQFYQQELNRLHEQYAEAINYHNFKDIIQQKQAQELSSQRETLNQQKEKDLMLFKQETQQKLDKNLQDWKQSYQEELKQFKQQKTAQKEALFLDLTSINQAQEQLEKQYQQFIAQTNAIRNKAEQFYQTQQLLAQSQIEIIEDLSEQVHQEQPQVQQLLQEQKKNYQELSKRISHYQDEYQVLKQLQEEKTKVETLTQWQQQYNTRIYIKDLLWGSAEEIKPFNNQKQDKI